MQLSSVWTFILRFHFQSSTWKYGTTPVHDALSYKTVIPDHNAWKNTLYTSHPSPESDAAWKELQIVRGVWVNPSEASKLSISGLTVGNDSTAALLGVQHNLHCIRFVRQVLHPDYYYPDRTPVEHAFRVEHAGHCLEALRESVMCTPDLVPRGVFWEDEERSNIAVDPSARQQCVEWGSLVGWMQGRSYELDDLLEHNP
ncbi:hypothetical protein MMC14_008725 [Varicellaria rhodocarpa]|nr:hypothetical protein [Varicellaria rhodocarpa]